MRPQHLPDPCHGPPFLPGHISGPVDLTSATWVTADSTPPIPVLLSVGSDHELVQALMGYTEFFGGVFVDFGSLRLHCQWSGVSEVLEGAWPHVSRLCSVS